MTATNWPALEWESLSWTSRIAESGVAASRRTSPKESYRAAIPPLIAELEVPVTGDLAAYAEDATEALVRFDSELGGEIAPFASLLLRSEAVASSQIEHLTASARQILTAEIGAKSKPNATLIAANTAAMKSALVLADELQTSSVLSMHEVLMRSDTRHDPGAFREEPVWIGTSGRSPVGATFVAPSSIRVPELVDDVMTFARRNDVPRLVQIAVAHAQFETVHPFTDGNGRTGRALMQSMLRGKGITRNVTVPVSAGLLTDTRGYHAALTAYRDGDVSPIIELTADASFVAVENARQLVGEIHAIQDEWRSRLRARSDSGVWKALDVVVRQPVLDAATLTRELAVANVQNVYPLLRQLTEAGILAVKNEYQFGQLWRSDQILHALDAFAERSGRRG